MRYDFRHEYGIKFENVDVEEALDLISMLPRGSAFVSKIRPEHSWSEQREALADILDVILQVFYPNSGVKVTRPSDVVVRKAALKKAKEARAKIETTQWEAVE